MENSTPRNRGLPARGSSSRAGSRLALVGHACARCGGRPTPARTHERALVYRSPGNRHATWLRGVRRLIVLKVARDYATSLWWIKRDFRVRDNPALHQAAARSRWVIPVLVFEPSIWRAPDASFHHYRAVTEAAAALREELRRRGGDILFLTGELPHAFAELAKHIPFEALFCEQETGANITYNRDLQVRRYCANQRIHLEETPRNGVIRGLADRNERMRIWNARMRNELYPVPPRVPMHPDAMDMPPQPGETTRAHEPPSWTSLRAGVALPPAVADTPETSLVPATGPQSVSEQAALEVLNGFLGHRGRGYRSAVSSVNTAFNTGSRLSVHLAWGTISLRTVVRQLDVTTSQLRNTKAAGTRGRGKSRPGASSPPSTEQLPLTPQITEDSASPAWDSAPGLADLSAFRSRLFWHDHFIQRLETEPEMEWRPLNRAFDKAPFQSDADMLARWLSGHTGFPMVDACIRCFAATGFLNFRMRAMLVSFACHVLHLPWQDILYPMARLMADYIPGIHFSQTQMQAGVLGINTIRIYSPAKQMRDHDAQTTFVRRWIPELRAHAATEILDFERSSLAPYPRPIVPYKHSVATMRSALYRIKASPAGRREAERVLRIHGSRRRGRGQ